MRIVAAPIFLALLSAAASAAEAAETRYAGQLLGVSPKSGVVELQRPDGYVRLNVGDILGDRDCIRIRSPGVTASVRRDNDSIETLGYTGENCKPLRALSSREWFTVKYFREAFALLFRATARTENSGGSRGRHLGLIGQGEPGKPAFLSPGERSLVLVWCPPQMIHARLLDGDGVLRSEATSMFPYRGVTLPLVRMPPGSRWTLELRVGRGPPDRIAIQVEKSAGPSDGGISFGETLRSFQERRSANGDRDLEFVQRLGHFYDDQNKHAALAASICPR